MTNIPFPNGLIYRSESSIVPCSIIIEHGTIIEYSPMLDYNPTPNFQKKSEILKVYDKDPTPKFWVTAC